MSRRYFFAPCVAVPVEGAETPLKTPAKRGDGGVVGAVAVGAAVGSEGFDRDAEVFALSLKPPADWQAPDGWDETTAEEVAIRFPKGA